MRLIFLYSPHKLYVAQLLIISAGMNDGTQNNFYNALPIQVWYQHHLNVVKNILWLKVLLISVAEKDKGYTVW